MTISRDLPEPAWPDASEPARTAGPAAHTEPTSPADAVVFGPEEAAAMVALYLASSLPRSVSLAERERHRAGYVRALRAVDPGTIGDDRFVLVYLPGWGHTGAETFAVHARTGRVLGVCRVSAQRRGESTSAWFDRLDGLLVRLPGLEPGASSV